MSVSGKARRQGKILDEIIAYQREHLPRVMREVPLADLRALAQVALPPLDFCAALKRPGVSLIAECKRASPTKGLLVRRYDPVALAQTYIQAGACAVSVLTDARHFQGSLKHLRDIKESFSAGGNQKFQMASLLRKDFIFHPYQAYEARVAGADAMLLIAAVLGDGELKRLLRLAAQLGMQALVEVHTEQELARVLPLEPPAIGINNRNLHTFEVDFENTARLRRLIPDGIVTVGESGLHTAADVRRMRDIGVDAILVGETLVRSKNVYETTRVLAEAGAP